MQLLVVFHSRTGNTGKLCDEVVAGAREAIEEDLEVVVKRASDAGVDDVTGADGIILGTSANFGYMSGMLKDFFERIYDACVESTAGTPYTLFVKGATDVDGAVASIQKIVTGMQWKSVLPPLAIAGPLEASHLADARELGATMAAGLETGIF